ncbi:EVE domain-containing protein [Vogesella facilis]|uniref:UPF0310 protein ACFOLG_04655 n=1 Tax=Vogesella facilis TaxID=1655232 RepID=A0ABV7RF03_9NEIS
MSRRYWIGVASRDHVGRSVAGGFAQLCHGKAAPLARLQPGDGLVYYSPREQFSGTTPCQCFTAIGVVQPGVPYQVQMAAEFTPWRRDIAFVAATPAAIRPLLAQLACIPDPRHWGQVFRFGLLPIGAADFRLIAQAMGATLPASMLTE